MHSEVLSEVVTSSQSKRLSLYPVFKRIFDFTASLFALIVLAGLLSGQAIGETLTNVLPPQVWAGLTAAGKMMPALGFAMLLKVMLSKEYAIFMILGFVLVAYGKLPLLAIALVGIAAAVYDFHVSMKTKNNAGGGIGDGI